MCIPTSPRKKSENDGENEAGQKKQNYDEILTTLSRRSSELRNLPPPSMLELAREVLSSLQRYSDEWSTVGDWTSEEARLYGLDPDVAGDAVSAARYNFGTIVGGYLRTTIDALERLVGKEGANNSGLLAKKRSVATPDGTAKRDVYGPEGVFIPGNTFEVYCLPQKDSENAINHKDDEAVGGDSETSSEGVTVVLGAGNQSALTTIDALHSLFHKRSPTLIKHHPLRPWLLPVNAILLRPLIERNYLAQVTDAGISSTQYILKNDLVAHVHLTGALSTANAVKSTLASSRPNLTASQIDDMVTSELGCVTPCFLPPARYTPNELIHAARTVVAGKKINGGCNCLSPQVILLDETWEQKDEFRSALVAELKRQPSTPAYYPGTGSRRAEFAKSYGARCTTVEADAAVQGCAVRLREDDHVLLVECGAPGGEGYDDFALKTEAFGPVLAIVELPPVATGGGGDDEDDWGEGGDWLCRVAVPFANSKGNIFGSLSCVVFAPSSQAAGVTRSAVSELRYGTVAINQLTMLGYGAATLGGVWGAHPSDATGQSGSGQIGNTYRIENIEKTVVWGPPLETKPVFDTASVPPQIVLDVLHEWNCSEGGAMWGVVCVVKMLLARSLIGVFGPGR